MSQSLSASNSQAQEAELELPVRTTANMAEMEFETLKVVRGALGVTEVALNRWGMVHRGVFEPAFGRLSRIGVW